MSPQFFHNELKSFRTLGTKKYSDLSCYLGLTAECFHRLCILKSKPKKSLKNLPTPISIFVKISAEIWGYFHNLLKHCKNKGSFSYWILQFKQYSAFKYCPNSALVGVLKTFFSKPIKTLYKACLRPKKISVSRISYQDSTVWHLGQRISNSHPFTNPHVPS